MSNAPFDVIVLGLGGMGSAAAYHLARRGARVLGLDQFGRAHDRGSSHGQTRIIRKAYFEHPAYVPLLKRAYELWDELDALRTDRGPAVPRLFQRCGVLMSGPPDGRVIAGVRRSADEHRLPLESFTSAEAAIRFPAFRARPKDVVLFEADAGILRVEDCVAAHCEAAESHSATLRFDTPVLRWHATPNEVAVETAGARFTAAKLVLCGGAWSAALLRELNLPLEVRRKVQVWCGPAEPPYHLDRGGPAFAYHHPPHFYYGTPALADGLVKVAEHTGGDPVDDPARVDRTLRDSDMAPLLEFVRQHLPGVAPRVVRHAVCLYTMTPDEHFIIDRHPQHENVVIASPCSGHGFKFASVVGEILADLSLSGRTNHPIDFLGLGRSTCVVASLSS